MADQDPRKVIADVLRRLIPSFTEDEWKALITPFRAFRCQHCKKANQVRVLDVKSLAELLDQGLGKPTETTVHRVEVSGKVALELQSDEALLALAEGRANIVDGQIVREELEPPGDDGDGDDGLAGDRVAA